MFFHFPADARWNPERSVVEFGIGSANMRVWCAFPGFQKRRRRNAASKPIIFTGPGSNSSPSEKFDGGY
jgi:hypothetical protein